MSSALDLSLDDVITSAKGRPGGGASKGKGKQRRIQQPRESDVPAEKKLDRSLDELVESSKGGSWKGKGNNGSSKGNAKGKNWIRDDDGWGGKNGYTSKGKSKGWGKKGKGAPSWDRPPPSWEHEDRADDGKGSWVEGKGSFGRSPKGASKGKGAASWSLHDDRAPMRDDRDDFRVGRLPVRDSRDARDMWPATHPERKIAARPTARTTSTGGFLRVEQADDEEDEPPRRRLGGVARAAASAASRAGTKRQRPRDDESEEEPPRRAKVAKATKSKMIKVTNIPKELKARDVREAFESEAGKITLCALSKGTAQITFSRHDDARKAVEAFHKGELNGKIISVVLVDA